MSDRLSSSRAGDQEDEAVSRDFCCFLCNGRQMLHGYISLHASFMSLCLFNSRILEDFEYGSVCSVNEEEPPTTHSLIITLPHHSVYLCHLLRKELLLRVFQKLGVYQPEVHLPAESLGFPTGGLTGDLSCSPHLPPLVYPSICRCPHGHHHYQYQEKEGGRVEGWEERFEVLKERYREWKREKDSGSSQSAVAEDGSSNHLSPT